MITFLQNNMLYKIEMAYFSMCRALIQPIILTHEDITHTPKDISTDAEMPSLAMSVAKGFDRSADRHIPHVITPM